MYAFVRMIREVPRDIVVTRETTESIEKQATG